jgi:predicted RNase H-like HicB family nuclease
MRPRRSRALRLTAALTPEGGGYVAQCIEVDVASQGDTIAEALTNLSEALALYFEDETIALPRATPIIMPVDVKL